MVMEKHNIAIVVGSLRQESINRKIADAMCAIAADRLDCTIVEIGNLALFNQDLEADPPAAWVAFKQAIAAADGILFVTPEYNRTIPGALKNAIDVGSRPYGKSAWEKKPAAIVTASPSGIGGFGANHALRQSCVFLDMPVMQQPEAYLGGVTDESFGEDGSIANPALAKVVKRVANAFADWVGLIKSGRAALAGDPAHEG
ncbi:MAG: NAD(P)H-dependent oxidoreductase [Pseudomonadota bacterium]|nr:NAD(P)H-dependent oxidoreductase [Pseudomonadota bacterium]